MADARPYKRSTLIVKKSLQLKIISLVVGTVLVAVAIIALDMFTALGRYVSDAGGDLNGIYENARFAFSFKVVIYVGGVSFLALIVSHKLAGPVYRFEKAAEQVAAGDLTSQVFLRQGDELLELREGFNAMVGALREKVSGEVSRGVRLQGLLEAALKANPSPELAQKLKEALSEAEKIGKSFRI